MLLMGITGLGLLVGVGFTIFAKLIIFILYGENYYGAVPALSILIWATSFSMIGTASGIWVIAENKNKYPKYFTLMGAVIIATLNALVILKWGFVGRSFTTLISEIFVSLVAPLCFSETREFSRIYFGGFKKIPLFLQYMRENILKRGK